MKASTAHDKLNLDEWFIARVCGQKESADEVLQGKSMLSRQFSSQVVRTSESFTFRA